MLSIIELLTKLIHLITLFLDDDLRPLCREFREYLHEKRLRNHPFKEPTPEKPNAEQPEKLYNRKEAAAYLLVHPRSVTRYRLSGKLKAVYADGNETQIRYREEDLKGCYFWKWGKQP